MKRYGLAIVALGVAVSAVAAERAQSGLQPGTAMPLIDVVDVSGPNKGKQLCYV